MPVISSSAGTDTPNPVITPTGGGLKYVTDVGTDFPAVGRGLGDFAVKDSGGKANVVVFEDDEYPSAVSSLKGFVDTIKKCPGCKVSDIVKMDSLADRFGWPDGRRLSSDPPRGRLGLRAL